MRLFPKRETPYQPTIHVVVAPNKLSHSYHTADFKQTVTETPHVELVGIDISRRLGLEPMDEKTRELYDAVRALHEGISSVSIEKYKLSVSGPERHKGRYIRGDWPRSLDAQVVDCLARHLGFEDEIPFDVRQQSEAELRGRMDAIIGDAVRQGIAPPDGWSYRR